MNKNNFLFILLLLGLNGCIADNSDGISTNMMITMKVIYGASLALACIGVFVAKFSHRSGSYLLKNIARWAVLIGLIVLLVA